MPRKYKKLSECPKDLNELIKVINLLPKNLSEFIKKKGILESEFRDEAQQVYAGIKSDRSLTDNPFLLFDTLALQAKYRDKLGALLSAEFIRAINFGIEPFSFQNATFSLTILINEKMTLLHIIESFNIWDIDFNRQLDHKPDFNFDKAIAAYSFNEDTSLQFTSFKIIDILTKHKIPIERVRKCPICNNIFWAKKLNAETCGEKKCSDTLGNRKRLKESKIQREKLNNHFKSRIKK